MINFFTRLFTLPCSDTSTDIPIGISRIPYIQAFLPSKKNVTVGWGRKPSGKKAVAKAIKKKCDSLLLEDGFIRSFNPNDPPLSLNIDHLGIYYDANSESTLEQLIQKPLNSEQQQRAINLVTLWQNTGISKYNHNPRYTNLKALDKPYVLVCDQVFNDLSIQCGLANAASFTHMLDCALKEHPSKTVVIKTHPDIYSKKKQGHFNHELLKQNERIYIIAEACHPVELIKQADCVYTVTSQMGFEALLWSKPVRTFGMPFYAGWGLTNDKLQAPPRRGKASLEQLIYAALIAYPRYLDPISHQLCEAERIIEHINLQRTNKFNLPKNITAIGFSRWKKPFIKQFLSGTTVQFISPKRAHKINSPQTLLLWGSKQLTSKNDEQKQDNPTKETAIIRVEDGFLRSVGLGADLVKPLSLVFDDIGIYYDASKPSRLEKIIQAQQLNDQQIQRAHLLREQIVNLAISKYNVATALQNLAIAIDKAGNKKQDHKTNHKISYKNNHDKVILVVGQVEQDASIIYGSPKIKTNLALLKTVRANNPNAYIIYKPHPDVLAGLRQSESTHNQGADLYNDIIGNVELKSLFSQIDELHTMTSLMGFEALLRNVKVFCYGLPFYAGWGLTHDHLTCQRRQRKITLDELVYAALISYPRYYCYERAMFVRPEDTLKQLEKLIQQGPATRPLHRKILRSMIQLWRAVNGKK